LTINFFICLLFHGCFAVVLTLYLDTEESVLEERNRRLAIGAKAGNQNLVETLLGLGASVTYKGMDEVTALHRACFGDNHQIVELLISYGAEVNGSTKEELLQPLHIVADKGNLKIAEILLNAGADINALALGDLTPLHIAAARGHLDMVERLIYGKGGKKAIVVAADQVQG
jgi:ankyrin repeat protein